MRHILLIFTIISLSLTTFARGVDHATAERVATAFWRMNAPQHLKELPLQQIASTRYGDNLYLWTSDSGFVIVAGSYSVRPVLAYGFGCDAQSDNMPPQMVEWIDDYASVIGQIERDGIAQEDGVAAEWHRLLTAGEGKTTKGGVPALITTKWNQGAPYNLMCPIDTVRQRRCAHHLGVGEIGAETVAEPSECRVRVVGERRKHVLHRVASYGSPSSM